QISFGRQHFGIAARMKSGAGRVVSTTGANPTNHRKASNMDKTNVVPISEDVKVPYNPRDLSIMRVDQSFAGGAVKQLLTDITVRKPKGDEWIRVHPEYRVNTWIHKPSAKPNELYYVVPSVVEALRKQVKLTSLYYTINSQGVTFLWPVSVDDPD